MAFDATFKKVALGGNGPGPKGRSPAARTTAGAWLQRRRLVGQGGHVGQGGQLIFLAPSGELDSSFQRAGLASANASGDAEFVRPLDMVTGRRRIGVPRPLPQNLGVGDPSDKISELETPSTISLGRSPTRRMAGAGALPMNCGPSRSIQKYTNRRSGHFQHLRRSHTTCTASLLRGFSSGYINCRPERSEGSGVG